MNGNEIFGADDYQALFGELSEPTTAEPVTEPQVPEQPSEPPVTEPTQVEEVPALGQEENPANPEPEAAPTPGVDEANQLQAKAFADLRATNNKYSKVFKQMQTAMGVSSEEEVIERLLNAGLNVQARQQNIDPTILARMQKLEEQNTAMQTEQIQKAVFESFSLLQKDYGLTNNEVMAFARELDSKGIDVMRSGVSVDTLYRGMNHDAILKRQVESEKQKWITQNTEAQNAPGVSTITGKRNDKDKTKVETMGELETLFNNYQQ